MKKRAEDQLAKLQAELVATAGDWEPWDTNATQRWIEASTLANAAVVLFRRERYTICTYVTRQGLNILEGN